MYHPTTRVLAILELLQTHARLSGTQLAARLEIDERTVRRYIGMLQDLGIPIEAQIGRHGGYAIRPGFKLPPLIFNNDEIVFLVLGLLNARTLGVVEGATAMESALAKIMRVLPASTVERVEMLRSELTLATNPPPVQVEGAILTTLSFAATQRTPVHISYTSAEGETERVFDPYGVVRVDERWYTVGFCHLRQDIRMFRVDRIRYIERIEGEFSRPDDFDCLEYVTRTIAEIPDRWDIEVLLELSLAEVQRLIPATMAMLEDSQKGVIFRAKLSDLDWVARFLVNLNCPFKVKEPPELKDALRRLAEQIQAMANESES
jgi:predicted DNA-binding transcriptional regulator YafY